MLTELLLALFVSLASCPLAFFFAGCTCCGTNGCPTLCAAIPPSTWTVTIVGIQNGTCTTCADYNATYIFNNSNATCCGCNYFPSTQCFDGSCNIGGDSPHVKDCFSGLYKSVGANTGVEVQMSIQNVVLITWNDDDIGTKPATCSPNTFTLTWTSSTGTRCSSDHSSITVTT